MPEEKLRTFIAITLPQEIKDFLAGIQDRLKTTKADVKWVEPKNIHFTLRFLGERDRKKIEEVKRIMDNLCNNIPAYSVKISLVGAFPKKESPRVIWVGLSNGSEETKEIALRLENEICKLGIPKESRPFSSHITLGRLRSAANRERLVEQLNYLEKDFPEQKINFEVSKITLFKSTLTPSGPIYEVLHEKNLKTN